MARLRVTLIHSPIGNPADQGHTVRSLGLRRPGQQVEHADTPDVRGMLVKVAHLVSVDEIQD